MAVETNRVPPGPEALGSRLARFRRDPIGVLTELTRAYGDVVGFKFECLPFGRLSLNCSGSVVVIPTGRPVWVGLALLASGP